jgi:AAA15 family ATPase/GTPase
MLQNIHIQNFRCFEDFKAEGFERVNLIGGKNNSGKTCLLEGILALRNNNHGIGSQMIEIAKLRNENFEDLIFQGLKNGLKYNGTIKIMGNEYEGTSQKSGIINKISGSKYIYSTDVNKDLNTAWNILDLEVFYISLSKCLPEIDFYHLFYKIENEDKTEEFINLLSKIDKSITKIRTIGEDGKIPKIKQHHNKTFIKLSSFGDAIKSIVRYLSPLISRMIFDNDKKGNYILLIDEIENGIHYTAYQEFWQKMFVLSKELNVQIFSTTHSLEMIQQFNKVAKEFEIENPEDKGAYFEMVRDEKTNQIEAIKHSTNILEEELDMNLGIRGEVFKDKISITPELLQTLNNAVKNAQTNLKSNNIPVPFIKDGWIWETLPDGTEQKLEELQSLNLK